MRVHFFQPEQFNRTEQKTNPFFDPLIRVCKKENIPYRIFIAEKKSSPNGYKGNAGNSWILFWPEILGLRLIKWFHLPSHFVWHSLGIIINIITFGKYRADICITVAGVHLEILQGIVPHGRLVDLQHGIIYRSHSGYFDEAGELRSLLKDNPQREYWLYGPGYRNIFLQNKENSIFLKDKMHIIGDVLAATYATKDSKIVKDESSKALVFSLQLIAIESKKLNNMFLDGVKFFLEEIKKQKLFEKYRIILKPHPRQGKVDISFLQNIYPWVEIIACSNAELFSCTVYHFTVNSTIAFEFAAHGIPTLFIKPNNSSIEHHIYYDDFYYDTALTWNDVISALENPEVMKKQQEHVQNWYHEFYSPFSEQECRRLLSFDNEKE